ncbi:MAG: pentapeptide repeat-containing protein [Pseudomonadota bacterium]
MARHPAPGRRAAHPPTPTPTPARGRRAQIEVATEVTEAALAHLQAISANARAAWFGLLALLAFVSVTLMAHEDADFFARGVETRLPLIGIDVPTTAFFIAAPLLVAALYIYLHLYLMTLWDALADMRPTLQGTPLFDRVPPTLMAQAALWYRAYHARRRGARMGGQTGGRNGEDAETRAAPPRALGGAMALITVALVWLAGPAVLLWLLETSTVRHSLLLSGLIALCFLASARTGFAGWRVARRRMRGRTREAAHSHILRHRRWLATALTVALILATFQRTTGPGPLFRWFPEWLGPHREAFTAAWTRTLDTLGFRFENSSDALRFGLARADLDEAELTVRRADWRLHEDWLEDFEKEWRDREGHPPPHPLTQEQQTAFQADASRRYANYIAAQSSPDLRGRNLRGARAFQAFLPGADLREAQMQGASLAGAQMQEANLDRAQMQGINLDFAQIQGASLFRAQMQGANLFSARVQGADFLSAQMQGASLKWAQMQGASLLEAEMQGAYLVGASMQGASCHGAMLQAAAAQRATLLCDGLSGDAIAFATGDQGTWLPAGLSVATCIPPETLPDNLRAAIDLHPARSSDSLFRPTRQPVLDSLLCDPNSDDEAMRAPVLIHGTWERRGDGAWVDNVTGLVFAPNEDGTWPDDDEIRRERRRLLEAQSR